MTKKKNYLDMFSNQPNPPFHATDAEREVLCDALLDAARCPDIPTAIRYLESRFGYPGTKEIIVMSLLFKKFHDEDGDEVNYEIS